MEKININGVTMYLYSVEEHNAVERDKEILDAVAKELPLIKKEIGLC